MAAQRKAEPAVLQLQNPPASSTPGGPDPCLDLLQQIIDLLENVADLFRRAQDDPHNLYRDHRGTGDSHPDYGSWDGHRQNYNYERDRLRQKIAEWESNDDCGNFQLDSQQQEDLNEAYEYKDKDFPDKPVNSMYEENAPETSSESTETSRDKIAEALQAAGIPPWAAAGLIVLVIAALADPEPFTKIALLIGSAAAIIFFITIGRESDIPANART